MGPRFSGFLNRFLFPSGLTGLFVLGVLAAPLGAQTSVTTWHYDNARTGANTNEVLLTPANVNSTSFGKLFTQPVDGFIIGHPLYLSSVTIPGVGVRSVVYVATMHDTVYAFDANVANAAPFWTTSLLNYSPAGATPVPISVKGCGSTVKWTETGVISTPVIDTTSGTIYLVAETYEGGQVVHRLHGLDVTTGKEQPGWPLTIAASYTQNGITSTFVDTHQMNRPGLLLNNGHIYIAFGGSSCNGLDHGWVMSYNVSTAQQEGAFDVEPGKQLASIWQKGAGVSADSDGNVYAETGEGAVVPGSNLGESVIKLSQIGSTLSLADWFTPYNWSSLDANDLDLNNGAVILPDQPGLHPHELMTEGKEGTIYVLDRDNLGHLCQTCTAGDTQIVQELPRVAVMGLTPAVWNGSVYLSGSHKVQIYSLANGLLSPGKSAVVGTTTNPMITANGTKNGILWFINGAVLTAMDPLTLQVLYTSKQAANGRDTLPPLAHFASPIAADGKVFIGTQNSLVEYGLLPGLSATAGNNQTGIVASSLPITLQVQAKDQSSGTVYPGVTVSFSDGGKGGTFGSPTGVTDATGTVSTTYTLPTKSATYTLTASATAYSPTTFSETAVAGSPTALSILSGSGQTGVVATPLPAALVVKVRDVYGNGTPGVAVTFSGLGGTFSANPVVTDNLGRATVVYTTATKTGKASILASVSGLHSVAFSETVIAGAPASVAVVSGDGQTAPVSTQLPQPLAVSVADQYGNAVAGVQVSFSDLGAGGSFSSNAATADSTGRAQVTYTTPPAAGTIVINATVAGVSNPAVFSVNVQ